MAPWTGVQGTLVIPLDQLARSANPAMKAAWYHKWLVHRRLRPEEPAAGSTTTSPAPRPIRYIPS